MKIEDFENTEPSLVLEEYFAGEVQAAGIFEDRFGRLRRQFTADINGTWNGRELVLDEKFIYDDGETDQRVWTIKKVKQLGNIAIILITHNEIHARLIADRYTFISLGEVIGSGTSKDLAGDDIRRLMAGGAEVGDLAKELA